MPDVSIVIPFWKKELYITDTLTSIINQTFREFEIIVVDDGSTTNKIADIIKAMNDSRIRLIYQEHLGISAARNRGIAESRSDLIAFLDADDLWKPTLLETVMGLYHRYPQAGVFSTAFCFKQQHGRYERSKNRYLPKPPWEGIIPNYFRASLGRGPTLLFSASMVRKDVFKRLGGFAIGAWLEDLEMWARIAAQYPIAWSSRVELIYRRDVVNSNIRIKITEDIKVIDTLKEQLKNCPDDMRADISNLIGKYYKLCSTEYAKKGDRKNAMRCINESLRFMSGHLLFKPLVLKVLLQLPVQVLMESETIRAIFDAHFYKSRER
jgi:glycosyltransferase involved in cell wall biosynthesis